MPSVKRTGKNMDMFVYIFFRLPTKRSTSGYVLVQINYSLKITIVIRGKETSRAWFGVASPIYM